MLYFDAMNDISLRNINLSATLDAFLPPHVRDLLHLAAEIAARNNWRLYLVGGAVRDMLLGRTIGDLDLTVEGDAIGLADALATQIGGRVTHHVQFGTAMVEVRDPSSAAGLILDFVTAREERYPLPAALPEVHPATLQEDLLRRDFTMNALAIGLNTTDYGTLYDVCGGLHDLELRQLRILHARPYSSSMTGSRPISRASWRKRTNTRSPARSLRPLRKRSTTRPRSTIIGVFGRTPVVDAETR